MMIKRCWIIFLEFDQALGLCYNWDATKEVFIATSTLSIHHFWHITWENIGWEWENDGNASKYLGLCFNMSN